MRCGGRAARFFFFGLKKGFRARGQKKQKIVDLRHLVFTGSPLPYYYRGLLLLNVVGLMGYGVFNRV